MAAAANDPGARGASRAARWLLAPPSCGVPSGTPRRSSLRLPLSLPGSFTSLTMITRTDSWAPSGRLGLRRRRPAPQRAERDAARDDVERVVEGAPQADVLGHDDAQVDDAERRPDAGDLGEVEDEAAHHRDEVARERELGDAREPHLAAHVEEPLRAAVVLRRHREPQLRPDAAVDLEVPAVPARVDGDQVLARDQELHHAGEQRLLLVSLLAPVAEREGAGEPVDARRLLLPLELDRLDVAVAAEPPEVAVGAAHERAQGGEDGDQGARPQSAEARIDARPHCGRDRPHE